MNKTRNIFITIITLIIIGIVAVVFAGMYKFNYLANKPGYDIDGNKINSDEQRGVDLYNENKATFQSQEEQTKSRMESLPENKEIQIGHQTWTLHGNVLHRHYDKPEFDREIIIEDPETLEYISYDYLRDAKRVYSLSDFDGIMEGVNPDTFKIYEIDEITERSSSGKHYTIENDAVYFRYFTWGSSQSEKEKISDNAESFKILGSGYVTADGNVYWGSDILDVDTDSFEVLKILDANGEVFSRYAKDSEKVFIGGWQFKDNKYEIFGANSDKFYVKMVDDLIFGIDDKQVYHHKVFTVGTGYSLVLTGVSPNSFKIETGKSEQALIVSDEDTNWYLRGSCDGWVFYSEKDMEIENKDTYLDEYVFC